MTIHTTTLLDDKESSPFVERERRDQIIGEATSRELSALLTRVSGGEWTTYRTRLLACNAEEQRIWIKHPEDQFRGEPVDLRPGERVGVSFRDRSTKCLFTSVVVGVGLADTGGGSDPKTVVIQWPENLQEMQRRVYRRVSPPRGQRVDVAFRVVRTADPTKDGDGALEHEAARPFEAPGDQPVRHARLQDLSAGGLQVLATEAVEDLVVGTSVICRFRPLPGGDHLELEARVRHNEPARDRRRSLGFQFLGLDASTEGQRSLARLASVVTAYRRSRSGAPGSRLSPGARSR